MRDASGRICTHILKSRKDDLRSMINGLLLFKKVSTISKLKSLHFIRSNASRLLLDSSNYESVLMKRLECCNDAVLYFSIEKLLSHNRYDYKYIRVVLKIQTLILDLKNLFLYQSSSEILEKKDEMLVLERAFLL